MDLNLTVEQSMVQETVRRLVDEHVLPHAVANDLDHKLDMGVIDRMRSLGLLGIVIPPEYGGSGMDFVSEALTCEELDRGEAAWRSLISVHVGLNSLSLLKFGTEEQKQRYLVPQAQGEALGCFALSEPDAGSDVGSIVTSATLSGDHYTLRGQKTWISWAPIADHVLAFARTGGVDGPRGLSAFIVEASSPGVRTQPIEHKLGSWAGSTGEVFFDDVEVPVANRLGDEGQGFEIAMHSLDNGRLTVAAGACGVIRMCLERSISYARQRRAFGKEIGRHQLVQDLIARMVAGYETSKLLVMHCAWLKDGGRRTTRESSLAKWRATEAALEAANLAIQVHGAYGYGSEYGLERYLRNARAPTIYEGTSQIHTMMQAEHALGYRHLNGLDGNSSPLVAWEPAPR